MNKTMIKLIPLNRVQELREALTEHEFNCTVEEGWTTEGGIIAEHYTSLSDEGKLIYAMTHAEQFAEHWLHQTAEDFESMFGDLFDEVFDYENY